MNEVTPVIPVPDYPELPLATVKSLVNLAYIAGLKKSVELCETKDPHPDQYSESWEFTARRVVNECVEEIKKEINFIPY